MKKFLLFVTVVALLKGSFAQTTTAFIENTGKKLAPLILSALQKAKADDNSKIAILNFRMHNQYSDSVPSELGIQISRATEHALKAEISKQKLSYVLLTANKEADDMMKMYFTPPNKNESDFWKQYLDNQTPDYYISGAYELNSDYSALKTINVSIRPYNLSLNQKQELSIPNQTMVLNKQDGLYLLNLLTAPDLTTISKKIALQIKYQNNIKNIKLNNFTYAETGLASAFSLRMADELEQQLVAKGNYHVTRNATRGLFNRTDTDPHVLTGKMYEEGDKMKLLISLVHSETNAKVSTVAAYLSQEYIKNLQLDYKPDNFDHAVKLNTVIAEQPIKSDFEINVWTNKGNENPVFKENEQMTLTVIASKACYLRFVYIFSDGTPVLMLDNLEIKPDMAGKPYQIPTTFVCAAPFGAEKLILNAKSIPFDPVNFKMQDGYKIITDPINQVVQNTRAFKQMVEKAEKSISLVTIK